MTPKQHAIEAANQIDNEIGDFLLTGRKLASSPKELMASVVQTAIDASQDDWIDRLITCLESMGIDATNWDGDDDSVHIVANGIKTAIDASTAELKATERNGEWIDKWGACKVCDGEIPHGHSANCDIYKLESQCADKDRTIAELTAELAKVNAQCAAMREALEDVAEHDDNEDGDWDRAKVESALSSDAGRNFVPIEDVKPFLIIADDPREIMRVQQAFLAKHGNKLK